MKTIKFSKPNITLSDIKLVGEVLRSGWLTHGKYTSLFENEMKNPMRSKSLKKNQ